MVGCGPALKRLTSDCFFGLCTDLCSNEIHEAVLHRSIPHLQAALERGRTSIDEPNEAGHTPLHLASNWLDGLSLLLDHGADHDKTNSFGEKPVELAIFHGWVESVQLLLKAGCSFDLSDDIGRTKNVFHCAVYGCLSNRWSHSVRTSRNDYFKILKIVIRDSLCDKVM